MRGNRNSVRSAEITQFNQCLNINAIKTMGPSPTSLFECLYLAELYRHSIKYVQYNVYEYVFPLITHLASARIFQTVFSSNILRPICVFSKKEKNVYEICGRKSTINI